MVPASRVADRGKMACARCGIELTRGALCERCREFFRNLRLDDSIRETKSIRGKTPALSSAATAGTK